MKLLLFHMLLQNTIRYGLPASLHVVSQQGSLLIANMIVCCNAVRVAVPRIRIGKRQTIETLINEEALLLAKFLRDERNTWIPRITVI